MAGMFQIIRVDDSIVRKLNLDVGINMIGNNLNPPLEGETIIPDAATINLLPTGEMFITPKEGILCHLKPYQSVKWKLLEVNTSTPLNVGDKCFLFPLKIWFQILPSINKVNDGISAKREMEEKNIDQTEPPDKKFCSENSVLSESQNNVFLAKEESSLLVRASCTGDFRKSKKSKKLSSNFCSNSALETKSNHPAAASEKSQALGLNSKNKKEMNCCLLLKSSTKPQVKRFKSKLKVNSYKEKKDDSEYKYKNKNKRNSNESSLKFNTDSRNLNKQKCKNITHCNRVNVQHKKKVVCPNATISNKPECHLSHQQKIIPKCSCRTPRQTKLYRSNSPMYSASDSKGFHRKKLSIVSLDKNNSLLDRDSDADEVESSCDSEDEWVS